MDQKIKIGLDIHGVIDKHPELFSILSKTLVAAGHEVHVITGAYITEELKKELENYGIVYTHIFSICEYHKSIGTPIYHDDKGDPHILPDIWDKTKALYCKEKSIDLHIDDSDIYGKFFKTPYAFFTSK